MVCRVDCLDLCLRVQAGLQPLGLGRGWDSGWVLACTVLTHIPWVGLEDFREVPAWGFIILRFRDEWLNQEPSTNPP